MAIDERARHELFVRVEAVLGSGPAETLMELLPPVGWADVATKQDLVHLEQRVDQRFELAEQRMLATMRQEMAAQTRTMLVAMIGVMFTFASAIVAALKL